MKPTLARISLAVALLGVAFGALDILHAVRAPGTGTIGNVLAYVYWLVGGAQAFPALGLLFTIGMKEQRVWSGPKKALWIAWLVPAFVIVLLGGFAAAAALV